MGTSMHNNVSTMLLPVLIYAARMQSHWRRSKGVATPSPHRCKRTLQQPHSTAGRSESPRYIT
jgi:hypothetical protein